MAKKATGTGGGSKSGSRSGSRSKTSVARASSSGGGGGGSSGSREKFDAGEAFLKLLQSPLVAELVALAATAALTTLASQGFTAGGSDSRRRDRAGRAVKEAGKAAASAVTNRLKTEIEEIRRASKAARSA